MIVNLQKFQLRVYPEEGIIFSELVLRLPQFDMKRQEALKFYSKYNFYIFPSVVALSCLLLIVFVIFPTLSQLISNQKTTGELANKHKALEAKASALEGFSEEDLKFKLSSLLNVFPTEKDFGNALFVIQGITKELGFIISSFTIGGGSEKGEQSYIVKITLQGLKTSFPTLLNKIESSKRVMRIQTIDITQGRDLQFLEANLSIEVFFASAPSGFGGVDSPLPSLSEREEELIASFASGTAPSAALQEEVIPTTIGKANPFE